MQALLGQINVSELVMAALTLTAAGVIGFWMKDIPIKIGKFLLRQFTTSLCVTSAHEAFYKITGFIEEKYRTKNFRNFKLNNGRYGDQKITSMSIGYGGHLILYNHTWFYLQLTRQDTQSSYDKETITLSKLGRNRKSFDEFFQSISTDLQKEHYTQVYKMLDYWRPAGKIPKRNFDTIFIEDVKKKKLIATIKNFIEQEQWYLNNGIPYHLGIMLYGPPGTGKTSIIKAIASDLSYDIYYFPVQNLDKIEEAMANLPEKSIIVIEDIDCSDAVHSRAKLKTNEGPPAILGSFSDFSIVNFSDVLNAIDGICSIHGRILITTTNHIEKLDAALIRPGRIDLQIEVGYVSKEVFDQFTLRFFGNKTTDIEIKDNLTCADLQNCILQKKTLDEVVKFARK